MSYLTLLIYPIILLFALVKARIFKRNEFNEEYLSISEVKAIQGLAAVCIVCHHTAQQTCAEWLASGNVVHGLDLFLRTGFLFNAVFFFCSGYGLFKSMKTKKAYLKGYFKKRILPVWFPYVVVCFLFTFVRLFILNEQMSTVYKITNFTGITVGYYFGWYVQAIIVFYIIFYYAFKYGRSDYDSVAMVFGGVIAWILLGLFIDHNIWFLRGEWWYNSTILFPIGLLFAQHEEKIVNQLKKRYKIMLPIVAIIFFISISVAIIAEKHRGYYGEDMGLSYWIKMTWRFETYMAEAVSAILFIWLIILICMKTELKNKVLSFLGSHTLEMYLTHAFFLETFAVSYNWKKGSAFYGKPGLLLLVTFAGTIPASIILKKLTEIVLKGIDKKK